MENKNNKNPPTKNKKGIKTTAYIDFKPKETNTLALFINFELPLKIEIII